MKKNLYTFLALFALVCSTTFAQKNVIFVLVTDTSLVYLDHEVSATINDYGDGNVFTVTEQDISYVTPENLPALNAADLIIMGRSVNSGSVVYERWDSITAPVMYSSPYVVRRGRADFFNNTGGSQGIYDSLNVMEATILVPSDPVFEGISASLVWWTGNCTFVDSVPTENQNNGTILVETASKQPLFGRFEANVPFYSESSHTPKGPRSYMGNGYDKPDMPWRWNYWGWSEDAEEIYFRELKRMAGVVEETGVQNLNINNAVLSVISSGGVVTISTEGLSKAEIYSIDGKLISTENSGGENIEIYNLSSGLYIVRAIANGAASTKKFIVQ